MEIENIILPEDKVAFDIIISHRGVIYGGYIRDVIAGVPPSDIDCVLFESEVESFIQKFLDLGYLLREDICHGTKILSKESARSIEFYSLEDDPCLYLTPVTEPDFYVNTLMYDGKLVMPWCHEDAVNDVIDKIHAREAGLLSADSRRIAKMLSKGYTVD